jgi:hypothetical protein
MKENKTWYEELKEKYFPDRIRKNRTREEIEKELKRKKYKNIVDWKNKNGASLAWASKQPWYSEIKKKYFPNISRWDRTKEEIEKELKKGKYKNIAEWEKVNPTTYGWSYKQPWYPEIKEKYFYDRIRFDKTREKIEEELDIMKYNSINEWVKLNRSGQRWASNQNWYKEIQDKYFPDRIRYDRTREEIEKELKKEKYKNIAEWINKNITSYSWAHRQTWYPEIKEKYFHNSLILNRTKKDVENELKKEKYKNIVEWVKENVATYTWAQKQSWYPQIKKKYFPNARS